MIFRILTLAYLFLSLSSALYGQSSQTGFTNPYDAPVHIYISTQNALPSQVFSGQVQAQADEGRVIDIGIYNVTGPIVVAPLSFTLNGPACPTWDAQGHRSPPVREPDATTTFSGSISLAGNGIPQAGSSVDASFSAKDNGYWTKCGTMEQVPFTQTETINFKIHSIKLALDKTDIESCKGSNIRINVKEIYPAGAGQVTWVASNTNVKVTGDNTGANIECMEDGDAEVTATLTAGTATFDVKVNVKVGKIIFYFGPGSKPWYPDGTFDATTLLTDKSIKKGLKWSLKTHEDLPLYPAGPATINEATGLITFNDRAAAKYTIIAECEDAPDCKEETIFAIIVFRVETEGNVLGTCDGESMNYKIVARPDVANAFAGVDFKFKSQPLGKPSANPNPEGTTDLTFGNHNNIAHTFTVMRALWYETAGDECAETAMYDILAIATINGKEVASDPGRLLVNVFFETCLHGKASPTKKWYSGYPLFKNYPVADGYETHIYHIGNFKRDVTVTIINKSPAASQFYKQIAAEEEYHKKQMRDPNGLLGDLFSIQNVMAAVVKPFPGKTELEASTLAQKTLEEAITAEYNRSIGLFDERRCAVEKEAKEAIKATFIGRLKCAYPDCDK